MDVGMPHEERISIAGRLRDLILERYGDAVLAIFITSSTAKGLDQPFSDLELTAVVRDGTEIEDKSYVYRGLLVEIEYVPASRILKTAQRVTAHWPVEATVTGTGSCSSIVRAGSGHLERAVEERDAPDFASALRKALTATIESRDKLRNASLAGDVLNIRVFGHEAADETTNLVLFLNRRYMVTSRTFYMQAFDCRVQPPAFRPRVELLLGVLLSSPEEMARTAEDLVADLVDLARTHGVSVDMSDLIVSPGGRASGIGGARCRLRRPHPRATREV